MVQFEIQGLNLDDDSKRRAIINDAWQARQLSEFGEQKQTSIWAIDIL
ncbi:MAG: hypothetical protein JSW22_02210 [Chloroflexota bacterium]|nr:MAG: hypothetical protein JSW22_02210 [Chloroflexota bacterium]